MVSVLIHADVRMEGQTDRQRDGGADMMKLIGAFCDYAKAIKNAQAWKLLLAKIESKDTQ